MSKSTSLTFSLFLWYFSDNRLAAGLCRKLLPSGFSYLNVSNTLLVVHIVKKSFVADLSQAPRAKYWRKPLVLGTSLSTIQCENDKKQQKNKQTKNSFSLSWELTKW